MECSRAGLGTKNDPEYDQRCKNDQRENETTLRSLKELCISKQMRIGVWYGWHGICESIPLSTCYKV